MNPFQSLQKSNIVVSIPFVTIVGLGLLTRQDATSILDVLFIVGLILAITAFFSTDDDDLRSVLSLPGVFVTTAAEAPLLFLVLIQMGDPNLATTIICSIPFATIFFICLIMAARTAKQGGDSAPFAVLMIEAVPVLGRPVSWVRFCRRWTKARYGNDQ